MVQGYPKLYTLLVNAVVTGVLAVFAAWQARKMNNRTYGYFAIFHFLSVGATLLDFTYLFIVPDSYAVALQVKQVSEVIALAGTMMVMLFLYYLQYDGIDPRIVIPLAIFTGAVLTLVFLPESHTLGVTTVNGEIVAIGIGKRGALLYANTILGWLSSAFFLLYCGRLYMNAPKRGKKPARNFTAWIWLLAILNSVFYSLAYTLPDDLPSMMLFALNPFVGTVQSIIFLAYMVKYPSILFSLQFRVDRLMVVSAEAGICVYEKRFTNFDVDDVLLGGLIHAIQQMSIDVLQKGRMRFIQLERGIILFHKGPRCSTVLISARSSRSLQTSIQQFSDAFEARYGARLEPFNGDCNQFAGADELVRQYFMQVPSFQDD